MKRNLMSICVLLILVGILTACSTSNTSTEDGNQKKEVAVAAEKESSTEKEQSDFKVTLLGTGSPIPLIERFGGSTLIEVGGEKLLFDTGRGTSTRLLQLGIEAGEINKVFLTHLHHDHTFGFPDVLITGSVPIPGMGGRQEPLKVWGPTGTQNMIDGFYQAYEQDVTNRQTVAKSKASGLDTDVHEFEEGVIYNENGIEIIAFEVDHGSMKPSFGFRVNYDGKSVVLSGDTTYSENLVKHAKGADLFIHEVIATESEDEVQANTFNSIASYHSTPEQAAEVFKEVNPKLAVYTHVISLGMTESEANFVERTNEIFDGEVVLGEDLMSFDIGDEITVKTYEDQ